MTRGNWTDKGCNLKSFHEDNKTYICECNHLTNFAVLVVSCCCCCFAVVVVVVVVGIAWGSTVLGRSQVQVLVIYTWLGLAYRGVQMLLVGVILLA